MDIRKKYVIYDGSTKVGTMWYSGNNINNLEGEITLFKNIDRNICDSTHLWFPELKDGKYNFDKKRVRFFIKNRVPEPTKFMIMDTLITKYGIEQYDELLLIDICNLSMVSDKLRVEKIN